MHASFNYKGITKIGDSTDTAIVGLTGIIHTYSNPVPQKIASVPTQTSVIDFSPATPFTALTTAKSFKENTRRILVGGNGVLLEIDTTIGSEAVTRTFTGFTGNILRILPLNGTNYFLVGGTAKILYKFDRTLATPQAQTPVLVGDVRDLEKSRDTSGYVLLIDLSAALKIYDLTTEPYSGSSVVAVVNNPIGAGFRLVAASSVNTQMFGMVDITPFDDAQNFSLLGTTASFGYRFGNLCSSGIANNIISVNTVDFFIVACDAYGIAIINFSTQVVQKAINSTTIAYDLVVYDNYRLVSVVAYE